MVHYWSKTVIYGLGLGFSVDLSFLTQSPRDSTPTPLQVNTNLINDISFLNKKHFKNFDNIAIQPNNKLETLSLP